MNGIASAVGRLANNGPLLARTGALLARAAPTVRIRGTVVVLRHAGVVEVLERDEDFTIAEVNAARMDALNGPFVLGMDRGPIALRERRILQAAVRDGDTDRVRSFVRSTAEDLVAAARKDGRLDVVHGLALPAAIRLVDQYFGVPAPDGPTMARWMRTMFHAVFLNVGDEPAVRAAAEVSADELHRHLDELVARRRLDVAAGRDEHDDVLTRLVRLQRDPDTRLGDEAIRRNISGVVVGAVEPTSKATAHAVDQLLRHPDALRRARAAALAGDMDTVRGFTLDALRFNPLNPVLARHAARPSVLGRGTRGERAVPAGSTVYAAVLPAMFDRSVFDGPFELRPDRPLSAYLHFGHGLHRCFGQEVNLVQIPELVAAVLRLDGLRRPRDGGAIRYDGPFPDRLLVEFDRQPAVAGSAP